jgi:hypothetical protein
MLKLGCEVTIESAATENDKGGQIWVFDALSTCVIVEDTGNLTDTCVIELPKKISWERDPRKDQEAQNKSEQVKEVPIKRGDKITVRLGYDGDLKTRFSGYVRNVDTKAPVRIECEDGMFLLKLAPAKRRGFDKKTTLKQLIGFLLEGTGVEYKLLDDQDIDLGPYRITKSTVAEELNELKREKSFKAYFRLIKDKNDPQKTKSVLYVGYDYPFDSKKKESFVHSKNIITEELIYRRAEDVKLKVKATSISRNNVRSELEMGDKEGEEIQVFAYNLNRDSLKLFAEKALNQYKYTGHRGSFETFGEPLVHKCDIAHIEPSDGKKGDYLIKKLEVSFGIGGYRQKIELGPILKASP